MSISGKITASSALFVLLLAGVLLYHLTLVRALVEVNKGFSNIKFRAATLALTIGPVIDELAGAARKYRVTRDAAYGERLLDLESHLTGLLRELQDVAEEPPEDRPAALLARSWNSVQASSAYRLVHADATHSLIAAAVDATDPSDDGGAIGNLTAGPATSAPATGVTATSATAAGATATKLAGGVVSAQEMDIEVHDLKSADLIVETSWVSSEGPFSLDPSSDHLSSDQPLIDGGSRCDLSYDVDQIDKELCLHFERLKQRAEAVLTVTRQSIETKVGLSNATGLEAQRVSWNVVVAALFMILLVSGLTARSIKEPLRRFTAGTRAVEDGQFFYQLDEKSGDEFADSAAAFNSMARRLGDLDRLKREFLAHVSHELKTPIVAMQETNALLLEQLVGPLNDKQRRIVSLNLEGAKRLSSMISNLLDLSRMEADALEYEFEETDLVELVEIVREELAVRMRDKGLWLEADLSPESLMITCDRNRLIQVIENLYENAVKFSAIASTLCLELSTIDKPPDHLPMYWRRRLARRGIGRAALLAVSDSGPGVPDDHKEKIFEKFYQVEKSQKKGLRSGVGLGLAISREIVEAHRGALWVKDNKGIGSTFFLMLPIDPRQVPPAARTG